MKMDEDDKKIRLSQIRGPAVPWEGFQIARALQLETFPREQLCNNNTGQVESGWWSDDHQTGVT